MTNALYLSFNSNAEVISDDQPPRYLSRSTSVGNLLSYAANDKTFSGEYKEIVFLSETIPDFERKEQKGLFANLAGSLKSKGWLKVVFVAGVIAAVALVAAAILFALPALAVVADSALLYYSILGLGSLALLSGGLAGFGVQRHYAS